MMQSTVRDYLDQNFTNATSHDCRMIAARARSHCVKHKIQFGRVMIGRKRYVNAYDTDVLAMVCKSYVGLRKKVDAR